MRTDTGRHVIVVALEVTSEERYARYREGMTPLLAACGGAFLWDFVVGRVLKSPGATAINRTFAIAFPSREVRERFFADPAYLAVRKEHFEASVASTTFLAAYDEPAG